MNEQILREFARRNTIEYARERQRLREANLPEGTSAYVGAQLFPTTTTNELSFDYFKDVNILPVSASVQAFGAEAEIASREGIARVSGEIPTIKRKIPLSGRALIALRREGVGDYDFVVNTLYNDLDNMIDAVLVRIEAMRWEAVATGKIVLAENGVLMTVDYGVPAEHKQVLTGDAKWDQHDTSNPIEDMQRWRDKIVDDTGIPVRTAWTSNKTVAHLLHNAEIRRLVYGDSGGSRAIALSQLNELLQTMDLPVIRTYDVRYRVQNENGQYETRRFLPENAFIMVPEGKLGDTLSGPTEEALMQADVDATEIAGIYAEVYRENEPPMLWTKAAGTAIPTFPMADSVFQATVF